MFTIEDNNIFVTRGDIVFFSVSAMDGDVPYHFVPGDVLRVKIFDKKGCENVHLEKDFPVMENAEEVEIFLTGEDTKIGEVINKYKDYWYEVELNPDTDPQTIIGNHEDGAALFRLYPEGADIEQDEHIPTEEDIPFVDEELDFTSPRPVANRVIAAKLAIIERDSKKDYVTPEMFGAVGDGVADDTAAIQAMFDAVKNGSGIVFPRGIYKINGRVTIKNVSNIVIENSGVFMPADGVTPLIGTLSLYNVQNAEIINLKMDGNVDNVPAAGGTGSESLMRLENCQNIHFVNLEIKHTNQCGVTGEGNKNVTFDNAVFEDIGEHCFYFGGNGCQNMKFNNLQVTDIGQNGMATNRVSAVVKCRMHDTADTMHDEYHVNGVRFNDATLRADMGYGCYRAVGCLFDIQNFTIENCVVKGETTAILQTNTLTDIGVIRNVNFDGRDIGAGMSDTYGTNAGESIETAGKFKISIHDSILKCETNFFAMFDYYNCHIICNSYMTSSYVKDVKKMHIIDGCKINVGSLWRIEADHVDTMELRNTKITGAENANQPAIYPQKDIVLSLINFTDASERAYLLKSNDKVVNLHAVGSTILGNISQAANIQLLGCWVEIASYINNANGVYSGVVRVSDGKKLDAAKHRVTQTGTSVTCDLRWSCIKKLTESNVSVVSCSAVPFTYSVSDNIVTITGEKGSNASVTFDVIVL